MEIQLKHKILTLVGNPIEMIRLEINTEQYSRLKIKLKEQDLKLWWWKFKINKVGNPTEWIRLEIETELTTIQKVENPTELIKLEIGTEF